MLHLFRPVKIWRHYITLCVGFFQNDNNQVNIGDPIEDIIISEYHTINIIQVYGENFAQTHVHESDCM